MSNQNFLPISQKSADIKRLVIQLIMLLSNQNKDANVLVTQVGKPEEIDPFQVKDPSEKS